MLKSKLGYKQTSVGHFSVWYLVLGSEQPQYTHPLPTIGSGFKEGIHQGSELLFLHDST